MAAETSWWQGALLLAVLGLSLHLLPAYLPEFSQGLAGVWFLPWAVSLLWWGLPHGAVDHTIGAKLLDAQHPQRWVWPVAGVYFFIMLLMVGLWWWQPVIAFMAFIGVTWIHWGCGDLWWSWIREPESFPTLGSKLSFVLWRGGLPMLVPLVVDPASYRMTAEAATQWLNSGTITQEWTWLETPVVRMIALVLVVALGLITWALAPSGRKSGLNQMEGLALLAFFLAWPALPAVGLYFTVWHGWRHVQRLQGRGPAPTTFSRQTMRQFMVEAAPMTLLSILILLGLAAMVPSTAQPLTLLGIYLMLISSLTVPHLIVVTWMDKSDGLWGKNSIPVDKG